VFIKGESVAEPMKPVAVSELINNFKRSGHQVHRTIVVLGKEGERVATSENSSKIKTIKDYFKLKHYTQLLDIYLPFAYRCEIIDSEDLYFIARAMLILKQRSAALGLLKLNKEVIIHNRVLMFEYILTCAQEGDYESMIEAIETSEKRFGSDAIHSKVLQALIHSNLDLEEYIDKMNLRYKQHAPYEILRAAYSTRRKDLMVQCLSGLGEDPRHKILGLRANLYLENNAEVIKILKQLKPNKFSKSQASEIVRISLQVQSNQMVKIWAEKAQMSPEAVQLEIARNQLTSGIMQNNFDLGIKGLEVLLDHENPTRTQILRLIRTSGDYETTFKRFLSIAKAHGYMLQFITEFAVKYSFKMISSAALTRLEGLMICDIDSTKYQRNYLEGVKGSGDISLMRRAYDNLEYIPNPTELVFEYATYFSNLLYELNLEETASEHLDEDGIESHILRKIVGEFTSTQPQYVPVPKRALVVNNSLKFGGAERQVVRCLSNNNFSKSLAVWNTTVNNSENSFIDDVKTLKVEILDYSKNNGDGKISSSSQIRRLLQMIPSSPPMNPGISQKIENLIQAILSQRPTTLHLWQDTTNILGAIAGLLCGVPKIVMSARSLPPFNLSSSTFPNKGPNYFYNNRFVRMNYLDVLDDDRVFLCHNSENGLEKYVEWLGGYEHKMLILRNGFELSEFNIERTPQNEDNPFNVGVVFRFVDVKQPFLWLDTAKLILEKTGQNVQFTMVGDGPLLEDAIQYAREVGINKYIEFKGYREDVVDILATFDLFLLTSSIEGLPNVLIEAQAMGVPVVSTNAGGARETFVSGKSGILVAEGTAEALSDAASSIISDEEFHKSATQIAKHHVREHFSLETMHANLENILFEGLP
jgi:glycosyltransferase involved in cell wall biosynthesis